VLASSRPFPTRHWARVVYPELEPDAALEQLWRDVVHVCRLDEPDPAAAWSARIDQIWQVASRLDALWLDALHFEGPGTDLTVGLLPSSRFAKDGGAARTRAGVRTRAEPPDRGGLHDARPGADRGRRERDEAARRLRLARDGPPDPLRGRP